MKLFADLTQRAIAHSQDLRWLESPMSGVQRRMLERDGAEVARATSIVRYAPGSYFSAHTHGGGEEFLVLEGVFSDEQGDYPAGTYVRNPVGSTHTPLALLNRDMSYQSALTPSPSPNGRGELDWTPFSRREKGGG